MGCESETSVLYNTRPLQVCPEFSGEDPIHGILEIPTPYEVESGLSSWKPADKETQPSRLELWQPSQ